MKKGDLYYTVFLNFQDEIVITKQVIWDNSLGDKFRVVTGQAFKSKEECQEYVDLLQHKIDNI